MHLNERDLKMMDRRRAQVEVRLLAYLNATNRPRYLIQLAQTIDVRSQIGRAVTRSPDWAKLPLLVDSENWTFLAGLLCWREVR